VHRIPYLMFFDGVFSIFLLYLIHYCISANTNDSTIKSKDKKVSMDIKDYIYYVPTDEGIISHLRQYDMLWNIGLAVNRTIKVSPFNSFHYPDVKSINLCKHFELDSVNCINDNSTKVFKDHNCIYTGLSHPASHYGWSEKMPVSQTFNYSIIDCLAGPLNLDIGKYPPFKRQHIPSGKIFKTRYLELFEIAKDILGITNDTLLVVVHWRRGDQLTTRCPIIDGEPNTKIKPEKIDHTLNCGTVKEFIEQVNFNVRKFLGTHSNSSNSVFEHSPISNISTNSRIEIFNGLRVETKVTTSVITERTSMINDTSINKRLLYVATNEKDEKQLQEIKGIPAKLFGDIAAGLAKRNIVLNSMEIFILELVIMCQASYLFAWGESALHRFLHNCRIHNPVLRSNLIIDNHRGIISTNTKPKGT